MVVSFEQKIKSHRVLPSFTEFFLSKEKLCRGQQTHHRSFTEFYRVLPSFTEFFTLRIRPHWVCVCVYLVSITEFRLHIDGDAVASRWGAASFPPPPTPPTHHPPTPLRPDQWNCEKKAGGRREVEMNSKNGGVISLWNDGRVWGALNRLTSAFTGFLPSFPFFFGHSSLSLSLSFPPALFFSFFLFFYFVGRKAGGCQLDRDLAT